jgi:hypothetical protein
LLYVADNFEYLKFYKHKHAHIYNPYLKYSYKKNANNPLIFFLNLKSGDLFYLWN